MGSWSTYMSIFGNSIMQIRKKWLNQLKNFFNKHFKEYYLASFCWWIPSSCENHCNLEYTPSRLFMTAGSPWNLSPILSISPEIEFLDMNWTKDSSLLLHAIYSLFYWEALRGLTLRWFFNSVQKKAIHEYHFVEQKNERRKPDKNLSLRRIKFLPRFLD